MKIQLLLLALVSCSISPETQVRDFVMRHKQELGIQSEVKIESLKGGLSKDFVCKINNSIIIKQFTKDENLKQMILCQNRAAELNIAPRIILVKDRIIAMEYIKGSHLPHDKRTIPLLADLLKKLHKISTQGVEDSKTATYKLANIIEAQVNKLKIRNFDSLIMSKMEKVVVLAGSLKREKMVFSHNDVNGGNIFFKDNHLWLIDFVEGLNDPFYDLASAASWNFLSEKPKLKFLETYLGRKATKEEKQHFKNLQYITKTMVAVFLFHMALDKGIKQNSEEFTLAEFFIKLGSGEKLIYKPEHMFQFAIAIMDSVKL